MEPKKPFKQWRAEKLAYVYFSRLNDLIINDHISDGQVFDFLIAIGDKHEPTGQLFAVEVKPYETTTKQSSKTALSKQYKDIAFPALLVMFDNKNDHGYYQWIKKPIKDGQLALDTAKNIEELNDNSLQKIVTEVKDWYSGKRIA
jgi:hypothetical protein